ncbi:MAG TPA: hypothetical protein VFX84_00700 [Candidatus Saccharimonadales bacterium]|nr:hypothetical protein [Candidatus Saccharimonadales bacterium]
MRLIPFRRRRKVKPKRFTGRWQELQKHCASRKTWPQAIAEADDLLGHALKKAGYKGKNMGERLVAAQHDLTDNERVWLGHKLRKRLSQDDIDVRKLKKQDVLDALSGFRQALRDLGALE